MCSIFEHCPFTLESGPLLATNAPCDSWPVHFWGFLLLRTGMGMNICLMQLHQAQGHCTWLGSDTLGASRGLANDRHLRHCSYVVMSPLEGQTTKLLVLLCECCDRTTEGAHYRSAVSSINMHKMLLTSSRCLLTENNTNTNITKLWRLDLNRQVAGILCGFVLTDKINWKVTIFSVPTIASCTTLKLWLFNLASAGRRKQLMRISYFFKSDNIAAVMSIWRGVFSWLIICINSWQWYWIQHCPNNQLL